MTFFRKQFFVPYVPLALAIALVFSIFVFAPGYVVSYSIYAIVCVLLLALDTNAQEDKATAKLRSASFSSTPMVRRQFHVGDDVNWVQVGNTTTISMAQNVYVGPAA